MLLPRLTLHTKLQCHITRHTCTKYDNVHVQLYSEKEANKIQAAGMAGILASIKFGKWPRKNCILAIMIINIM